MGVMCEDFIGLIIDGLYCAELCVTRGKSTRAQPKPTFSEISVSRSKKEKKSVFQHESGFRVYGILIKDKHEKMN